MTYHAGRKILLRVAGKDASTEFVKFHNVTETLLKYPLLHTSTPACKRLVVILDYRKYGPRLYVGDVSDTERPVPTKQAVTESVFVPYGDPSWLQGWNSKYYNESHRKLRY